MNKKWLLGFGLLATSTLPLFAVVGCDLKKEKESFKKSEHLFYIMVDSLTSSRFLDS